MKKIFVFISIVLSIFILSCSGNFKNNVRNPFPEELSAKINRGLVCFKKESNNNFLSWRLLPGDPNNPEYFIWRKKSSQENSNAEVIAKTNKNYFIDYDVKKKVEYLYGINTKNVLPDEFQKVIDNFNADSSIGAITFDIQENYRQARVVTGDLTGDGELEVLIIYSKMNSVDPYVNAWQKSTDTYKVAAFRRDGQLLWKNDLGYGIEAGGTYSPVVVWDLDGDGKCEVILKTNKSQNPLDFNSEFLTILKGENGKIIRETKWPAPPSDNYNSNSRNYIAIAHLDGQNPSIIVGRGLYFKQVLCAYDINLNKLWERFLGKEIEPRFGNKYIDKLWSFFSNDKSRDSHSLPIADVDGNGTEEIFWGEHCITKDGDDLWKVKDGMPYYGHPDIVYPADIIPNLPGLETFYCREGWSGKQEPNIGFLLVDKSGKTIWAKWGLTHVDGGWADKVVPNLAEPQLFAFDIQKKVWKPGFGARLNTNQYLCNSKGEVLMHPDSSWVASFTVDWEGNGIKDIVTEQGVMKRYNGQVIKSFQEGLLWAGDLYGDQREELVYAPCDGKVYIIFNTQGMNTIPMITKIADRRYRNDLSRTAMQFNDIPTTDGYIPLKHIN